MKQFHEGASKEGFEGRGLRVRPFYQNPEVLFYSEADELVEKVEIAQGMSAGDIETLLDERLPDAVEELTRELYAYQQTGTVADLGASYPTDDPAGNPALRDDKAWGPFVGSTQCTYNGPAAAAAAVHVGVASTSFTWGVMDSSTEPHEYI